MLALTEADEDIRVIKYDTKSDSISNGIPIVHIKDDITNDSTIELNTYLIKVLRR